MLFAKIIDSVYVISFNEVHKIEKKLNRIKDFEF